MPKWPAIVTHSAVANWTDETTVKFKTAVEQVLKLNPILMGRLYKHRPFPFFHPRGNELELRIEPGFHAKNLDQFATIQEAPSEMANLSGMNCTSAVQMIQKKHLSVSRRAVRVLGTDILSFRLV